MKKSYLLTPGPTPIPESVLGAMNRPIIHHRTVAFEKLFEEVRAGLKQLFQTKQEVLMLAATGSGAMEAAVTNLHSKGDTVLVINAGKFGERWTKIAQAYGLKAVELKLEPGDSPDAKQVEDFVRANAGAKSVLFQASETSTGAAMPTQAICKIAANAGMLSICDAITALGVFELPMDAWGIDCLITGSQKALMLPPGLAMIALSPKAWAAAEKSDLPKFYFDLKREHKMAPKNQTAWTPAISIIMGLHESLRIIHSEGLQNVFKRHDELARATRAAVKALGLEMLAKKAPSNAVSAVLVPTGVKDGKAILKTMRDKHGVTIIGGQDELEGKIIRLSHIGYCDRFDVTTAIGALELALLELGHPLELGRGVGAALKVFSEASS